MFYDNCELNKLKSSALITASSFLLVFIGGAFLFYEQRALALRMEVDSVRQLGEGLASSRKLAELTTQVSSLSMRIDELERRLAPPSPTPAPTASLVSTPRVPTVAERLRDLKPQLASGKPIKGWMVTMARGGKGVDQEVALVIGHETRIQIDADNACLVQPALNDDGTVTYNIAFEESGKNGSPARRENFPRMVNYPWAGFTITTTDGRVINFEQPNIK